MAERPFSVRPLAVVKISQVLLDRFSSNLQGLWKRKELSSEPEGVSLANGRGLNFFFNYDTILIPH